MIGRPKNPDSLYCLVQPARAASTRYYHNGCRCDACYAQHIWAHIRNRAKAKGAPFELSPADLLPIPETCPLLGVEMTRDGGAKDRGRSPSIDRLDNRRGYTKENIWWVSYRANVMKGDSSVAEMYRMADAIWAEMKRRGLRVPPTRLRPGDHLDSESLETDRREDG